MKWNIFRIIVLIAGLIALQGIVMPLVISSDVLPLWGIITIASILAIIILITLDELAQLSISKWRDKR